MMSIYKTPTTLLKSIASKQSSDIEDACSVNTLLLDLRVEEIINVSPLRIMSDIPISTAISMKSCDADGKIIESKSISSSTKHVFSGLVEIIDPQLVSGGVEYATFKIIETKAAFPNLPKGKLIFAHADQDRHFASFGILWAQTHAAEDVDQKRHPEPTPEVAGNAECEDGKSHTAASESNGPAKTAGASGGMETLPEKKPSHTTTAKPVFGMKKSALIKKYLPNWPTIEGDLHNAANNELWKAKNGNSGWIEAIAIEWAKSKGKWQETRISGDVPTGSFQELHYLGSQKHLMGK